MESTLKVYSSLPNSFSIDKVSIEKKIATSKALRKKGASISPPQQRKRMQAQRFVTEPCQLLLPPNPRIPRKTIDVAVAYMEHMHPTLDHIVEASDEFWSDRAWDPWFRDYRKEWCKANEEKACFWVICESFSDEKRERLRRFAAENGASAGYEEFERSFTRSCKQGQDQLWSDVEFAHAQLKIRDTDTYEKEDLDMAPLRAIKQFIEQAQTIFAYLQHQERMLALIVEASRGFKHPDYVAEEDLLAGDPFARTKWIHEEIIDKVDRVWLLEALNLALRVEESWKGILRQRSES